jgi:hypothetical protein
MLAAVQAVVDAGAEPKHYAWFASTVYAARGDDGEGSVTGVANLATSEAYMPAAASAFLHWFSDAGQVVQTAIRVAAEDRAERMSAGVSEKEWLDSDCQEPVFKAERLLALSRGRPLAPRDRSAIRAAAARLEYVPGYDGYDFPLLRQHVESGGCLDMGVPTWAT